ncbi:MAG: hypothetical protein SF162_19860 [bacterium]|nr:hypothetical protein [bacterium]
MEWSGKKNGELLRLMTGQFDVFITMDANLQYQQNLRQAEISVIVLSAQNSTLETLKPLMSRVLRALETLEAGQVIQIRLEDTL